MAIPGAREEESVPIAIIGMGTRFPGDGFDSENFWEMLLEAQSARSKIPETRYNIDAFHHPDGNRVGAIVPTHAHFLKQDFTSFDAPFFSIKPKEAKAMDPTHRMLLEVTYEGFENAGVSLEDVAGSQTSCYIGTFTSDFSNLKLRDNEPSIYHATGMSFSLASNRLSWFYNMRGPSMTLDTACSSSLTAFHLGCQSLRTGESEMSVVGGCNLMFGPDMSILLGAAKILSPDGISQSFDHKANGFSRGEGIGITILKRLDDAIRDQDTIRAVVLSSAANQDGRTPGLSLPNSEAQEELIRTAYRTARVDPSMTGYVEAHGTGTQAGDPLETSAIFNTIGAKRSEDMYIGSVKTNIGHLEGAAGIAGVIKAALMVERGLVPPNLWFEKINPQITLPDHVKIPTKVEKWPSNGPRRASINSFGFGGANAHAILEDAYHYLSERSLSGKHATIIEPQIPVNGASALTNGSAHDQPLDNQPNGHGIENIHVNGHINGNVNGNTNGHVNGYNKSTIPKIFVVSSSDKDGVKRHIDSLLAYLARDGQRKDPSFFKSLAYTLNQKRTQLPWKTFVVASDVQDLSKKLLSPPSAYRSSHSYAPESMFIFTGQGAQWFAMGRELLSHPIFYDSIVACEDDLHDLGCKWELIQELSRDEKVSRLYLPEYSQPSCTALQIALVDLMTAWGFQAAAVAGHSSGEIAAAYCAGIISRKTAMAVAYLRGQSAEKIAKGSLKGGMMAVSQSAELTKPELDKLSRGKLVVACQNSPNACTISGDEAAIDELAEVLRQGQVGFKKLDVEVAYHSHHMQSIRESYEDSLSSAGVSCTQGQIPMFSSVTGNRIDDKDVDAEYWGANLVSQVKFGDAIHSLLHYSNQKQRTTRVAFAAVFVEIGPHSALRPYLLDIMRSEDKLSGLSYTTLLRRGHDCLQTALQATGELYIKGCIADLTKINNVDSGTEMLVDLPPYAWNHSLKFWEESYLSRDYRLCKQPRKDLIGAPVPGTIDPQWRAFLRISENPWIKDHRVQSNIVYPGAGFLVMAIEGARQMANVNEEVIDFELRDVAIISALRIPDNGDDDDQTGVEVQLQFHPRRTGTKAEPSNLWIEFTVSSRSEDGEQWQTHARGLIQTRYKSQFTPSTQRETALKNETYRQSFLKAKKDCHKAQSSFLYDTVEAIGMYYGKTFRNISDLWGGNEQSCGVVTIPDTKSVMPAEFEFDYLIHPATLDSVLHLLFPAISGPDEHLSESIVPYSIDRLRLSASMPSQAGTELHGFASAKKTSFGAWDASINMSTEEWSQPLINIQGLGIKAIGGTDARNSLETRARCFEFVWREDIDLMTPSQIRKKIYQRTIRSRGDDQILDDLDFMCLVYISAALPAIRAGKQNHASNPHWFGLYLDWMENKLAKLPPIPTDVQELEAKQKEAREKLVALPSGDIALQMIDRIGRNLVKIYNREIEPLQVMLEGELLFSFYSGAFGSSFNTNVAEYVGLYAGKRPGISVLEIGAGTGGTTFHVLNRLRNENGSSNANLYYFTDISTGFLGNAAERFKDDAAIMEFGTLNVENDPMEQGFTPESFDIIVCANVLHATKSIAETLANCRSLLKPGGKLVLSEVTTMNIWTGFIMGPLPGWWLGENDDRKGGPLMTVDEWDGRLRKADFSGIDIHVRGDVEESKEPVSLIVSTKVPDTHPPNAVHQYVVISGKGAQTADLCNEISRKLTPQHKDCSVIPWDQFTIGDIQNKHCICAVEWENVLLADIRDGDYDRLQTLIFKAKNILWITGGATMETSNPHGSLMVGLSRAIRNENSNVSIATLDIERAEHANLEDQASVIVKVSESHSSGGVDHEFAARNGLVHVPRAMNVPGLDRKLQIYQDRGEPETTSFVGCKRPLKLSIKTPGLLDTFRFVDDQIYHQELQDDWIEVEVKAVGLNFKDVLVAMGHLNEDKLGVDCSGVVTRVGSQVTQFKPGDRVMTASASTFATYCRFPSAGGIRVPESLSFEEAASMPLVYLTAYYALVTIGNLKSDESVLIHVAAGGVGQAAIVMAQHIGAEIFATVGSDEKKEFIMKQYGIPQDHIFNSRDFSFAQGIMRMTNGLGVDVVLNSLAGEALRLSWHCLGQFGRFLEIGKADLFANTGLDMKPFLENRTYAGVNLLAFENNPTPRAVKLYSTVGDLINDGKLTPIPSIQHFTFSEIEKAFRLMQTGKHTGKIVVSVSEEDEVMAVPVSPSTKVSGDATYLLAGGLGGICREIGRWLAMKGAKHLVFLSRHAASGEENIAYIRNLQQTYGTNAIAFNCNVGDRKELQDILDNLSKTSMPPIKGCVTGAMVLKDGLFEDMTVDQFRTAVGPKVHGTWNLHELLPKDMEFFVMLSSLAGVAGHRGQGNYGAGNVFQDVMAAHRREQGLPAMTIDISYLLSTGFVADNPEFVENVKRMGLKIMQKQDTHGLMSTTLEGPMAQLASGKPVPPQVMMGLPLGEYSDSWYWITDGKFAALLNSVKGRGASDSSGISLREELSHATSVAAATDLICDAMVERLAKLMMVPAADIDVSKPLTSYGLDSLVAVEVRNWVAENVQVEVSVFEIMDNTPMRQLASDLAGKSKLIQVTET